MEKARWTFPILVLLSLCAWTSAAQPERKGSAVKNSSYEVAGERVLRHEVTINAALEQVWHSVTTTEGLRTWVAPVMEFELRTGGKFHSNYRPGAQIGDPGTIYNTVLSYLPQKMLSFKIGLTDRFPEGPREAGTLLAVVQFEAMGKRKTKAILSVVGFGQGSEWDTVYKFFDTNNPSSLSMLRESLEKGPIDWQKPKTPSKDAK